MKNTIDQAGRVVIPKRLRQAAGLLPGTALEMRLRGNVIEIEPAPRRVRLVRRGSFTVAVAEEPGPPLSAEVVERTRDDIARERV